MPTRRGAIACARIDVGEYFVDVTKRASNLTSDKTILENWAMNSLFDSCVRLYFRTLKLTRRTWLPIGLVTVMTPVFAQEKDPMVVYKSDDTTVRTHLQFGLNLVAERTLFWDLAAVTAPSADFDPDTEWLEVYVKPGLSFQRRLETGAILYGKFSAVASYTWGTDAFDTGDEGDGTLEEYYLGLGSGPIDFGLAA